MKKTTNKKKTFAALTATGLVLTAPFAAFAYDDTTQSFDKQKHPISDLSSEERVEFMKLKFDQQIEHATTLVHALDSDDDVDTDRLEEIIEEFAELESSLDELDVSSDSREDLRDAFFEIKEDAKELSFEFRDLIKDAFSVEEREAFREQFEADKNDLREQFGLPEKSHDKGDRKGPKVSIEQIAVIDSDLAEQLEKPAPPV